MNRAHESLTPHAAVQEKGRVHLRWVKMLARFGGAIGSILAICLLTTSSAHSADTSDDITILLKNGGSERRSPVFNLILFGDGHVIFDGRAYVKYEKVKRFEISAAKVKDLAREIEALSAIPAAQSRDQPAGDRSVTTITFSIAGRVGYLVHDRGADGPLERGLSEVEKKISEAVGLRQFLR